MNIHELEMRVARFFARVRMPAAFMLAGAVVSFSASGEPETMGFWPS